MTKIADNLSDEELMKFARRFIAEAIDARGFGVPGKSELEVVMFDELLKSEALRGKTNYEMASTLRVSESRVKSLLLIASIRHSPYEHKECVREVIQHCLAKGALKDLDEKVQLAIENPAKRRELEHALKRCNETPEYGRNREILIFSPHALLALLGMYLGKNKEVFLNWLREQTKDKDAVKELKDKSIPIAGRVVALMKKAGNISLKAVITEGAKYAFATAVTAAPAIVAAAR
jgi:hypothetical protein